VIAFLDGVDLPRKRPMSGHGIFGPSGPAGTKFSWKIP